MATIDSSIGKAPPARTDPPARQPHLLSGLERPRIARGRSDHRRRLRRRSGDRRSQPSDSRGRRSRQLHRGARRSGNKITGQSTRLGGEGEIAVDRQPGSLFEGATSTSPATAATVYVFAKTGGTARRTERLRRGLRRRRRPVDRRRLRRRSLSAGISGASAPSPATAPVSNANYAETGIASRRTARPATSTTHRTTVTSTAGRTPAARNHTAPNSTPRPRNCPAMN